MFRKQAKFLSEELKTENPNFELKTTKLKGNYLLTPPNVDLKHLKQETEDAYQNLISDRVLYIKSPKMSKLFQIPDTQRDGPPALDTPESEADVYTAVKN